MRRRLVFLIPVILGVGVWAAAQRGAWSSGGGGEPPGDLIPSRGQGQGTELASLPAESVVVLLGTSLTARGGDWFERVTDQARALGINCSIERLGGVGENSSWGLANLEKVPDEAAVLVIEFTMNDAAIHRGMSPEKSLANHERLISRCRERGITPVLCTMSPATGSGRLKRPWLEDYQDLYRVLARKRSVALLDPVADWERALAGSERELIPDGIHPTDKAMARIFAPRLADFLSKLTLEKPKDPAS